MKMKIIIFLFIISIFQISNFQIIQQIECQNEEDCGISFTTFLQTQKIIFAKYNELDTKNSDNNQSNTPKPKNENSSDKNAVKLNGKQFKQKKKRN